MADLEATIAHEIDQRPPPNQAHLKYRPDIDGLRAIAVLPVIFYHYSLGFPGGYVGVDIFYVISGFLITKIIYDLAIERKFSFLDFYDRRIRRLFPALFVMLAAVTLFAATQMIWFDLSDYGRSLFAATAYVSNLYFYITAGYFTSAASVKPLLHTWSLAVEEQFYIVVPFVLFALVRLVPRRWHVAVLVALSLLSFIGCVELTSLDTPAAFYLLPARAWELGMGGALAIAAPRVWDRRWLAELLAMGGLVLILFAVFGFSDATPFPSWYALLPTAGTAAILSTGGRSGALVEQVLSTRPFTFVGKISYSLYLWHWPVIVALSYGTEASIARSAAGLALTFALATASWLYVELPFRRRQLLGRPKQLFAGALLASALAATTGVVLYLGHGFPHPRQLVALVSSASKGPKQPDCAVTAARVRAEKLCVRGAPGIEPSFIFAGDSHATALSEGFFAAARNAKLSGVQFTANAFVPLPGRHALTTRQRYTGSDAGKLTAVFIAYLKRHPELRTIYLTGFWFHEVSGASYRNAPEIDVDDSYDGSGAAYDPIAFRHSLGRLAAMFPDRQFVIIDDVPSGTDLDLQQYARVLFTGRTPPSGLPRAAADAERSAYEPVLQQLAATHANVRYAPVLAGLCGPRSCPLFSSDGVPIYRNGDHLSSAGSLRLAPALKSLFPPAT